MYKSFRINYEYYIEGISNPWRTDETEFDVKDADFVAMFNELISLFNKFAAEQGYDAVDIGYIEEVPYDGE